MCGKTPGNRGVRQTRTCCVSGFNAQPPVKISRLKQALPTGPRMLKKLLSPVDCVSFSVSVFSPQNARRGLHPPNPFLPSFNKYVLSICCSRFLGCIPTGFPVLNPRGGGCTVECSVVRIMSHFCRFSHNL